MSLDNRLGDGQAQPSAIGGGMRARRVGAVEAIKQSRKYFWINVFTSVFYRNFGAVWQGDHNDPDIATCRGMAQRIG